MEGWIKLHRKIVDNPFYFSEKFTRSQAWIDLLILANHKENFYYQRGIKVHVKRGQIGMSLENIAKRFKWSRGKVERFISELEMSNQIVRQKGNVTTLLTVVNYDIYQEEKNENSKANNNANSKQNSKANGQQTAKQTDTNKNDNNENNEKENNISGVEKTPQPKKIFFKDSEIATKIKFKEAFPDWNKGKLLYYYDTVTTWSNEGNKKVDWKATVRNWASRDEKEGKLKFDMNNANSSGFNPLQGTLN